MSINLYIACQFKLCIMTNSTKPTVLFWVIGIVALIWNLMGVMAYIDQAFIADETIAALPEAERALYENVPPWVTAAFAIAVFGGALGCILLLLKKKLAINVFIVSFIAIVIQMIYNLGMSGAMDVYGPGAVIMPIMVIVIGIFLIYYAKACYAKGWIS